MAKAKSIEKMSYGDLLAYVQKNMDEINRLQESNVPARKRKEEVRRTVVREQVADDGHCEVQAAD